MQAGPALVSLTERKLAGAYPSMLARTIHEALIEMACEAALRAARASGVTLVVLSGGCFQNRILAEGCRAHLERAGLEVLTHRLAPPNDGGIALGQAAVAAARARA
jgi:hydrogenase maturation protein HypF